MRRVTILFFAAALLGGGCYNEDKITPTQNLSVADKFPFPQDGTPADAQAVLTDIYERYGVKVIYKGFTESDFKRAWLAPAAGSDVTYTWDVLGGAQLLAAAQTLRDKVFGLLPEDIVRAAAASFPYLYLVDNLRQHTPAGNAIQTEIIPAYPAKALNAMTVNLQMSAPSNSYIYKVYYPLAIASELFYQAFYLGLISMPDSFFDPYTTMHAADMKSYRHAVGPLYQNYWARQGRIPMFTNDGLLMIGKNTGTQTLRARSPLTGKFLEVPYFFHLLCVDRHWQEHDDQAGSIDEGITGVFWECPVLMARLRTFYDRMKEQGIDFDVIQNKLYAGTTVDTSRSRVFKRAVSPDQERQTYIYYDLNSN